MAYIETEDAKVLCTFSGHGIAETSNANTLSVRDLPPWYLSTTMRGMKKSAYDNAYTDALESALSQQGSHSEKKAAEMAADKAKNEGIGRAFSLVKWVLGLIAVVGLGYFMALDPDNAGAASIAVAVGLALAGIVFWLNK